jgi:type I restriction enzyme R subunit
MEKSYTEYMEGFTDTLTGEARRGFIDIVSELETRFLNPADIDFRKREKAFVKLFGNICGLKTYCKTTMSLPR